MSTSYYLPQGFPLWAVRACSIDDAVAEVGLVIGWEGDDDHGCRWPIVAKIGAPAAGTSRGEAVTWINEIVRSDEPGSRWVERVELYPTAELAHQRAPHLFDEAGRHHDELWPADAPQSVPGRTTSS